MLTCYHGFAVLLIAYVFVYFIVVVVVVVVAESSSEASVRVLDLANFEQVRDMVVVDSAVFALRIQTSSNRNLLAAADVRSGIRVFDLEQQENSCLYEVQIYSKYSHASVVVFSN